MARFTKPVQFSSYVWNQVVIGTRPYPNTGGALPQFLTFFTVQCFCIVCDDVVAIHASHLVYRDLLLRSLIGSCFSRFRFARFLSLFLSPRCGCAVVFLGFCQMTSLGHVYLTTRSLPVCSNSDVSKCPKIANAMLNRQVTTRSNSQTLLGLLLLPINITVNSLAFNCP